MSQRTADLYLVDLLDAADAIACSVRGVSFDEFIGKAGRGRPRRQPRERRF